MIKHSITLLVLAFSLSLQTHAQKIKYRSVKTTTILINGRNSSSNDTTYLELNKPKNYVGAEGGLLIYNGFSIFLNLEIQYVKHTNEGNGESTDWYYIVNNYQYGYNVVKIKKLNESTFDGKYSYLIELDEFLKGDTVPIMSQFFFINRFSIEVARREVK